MGYGGKLNRTLYITVIPFTYSVLVAIANDECLSRQPVHIFVGFDTVGTIIFVGNLPTGI